MIVWVDGVINVICLYWDCSVIVMFLGFIDGVYSRNIVDGGGFLIILSNVLVVFLVN